VKRQTPKPKKQIFFINSQATLKKKLHGKLQGKLHGKKCKEIVHIKEISRL
jgi:hypothetical protein